MAVVKAQAYGHGLIPVSRELTRCGADYLGVSFLEEGVQLRQAGIDVPILVMGGLLDEQVSRYFDFNLEITVSSVWKGKQVAAEAARRGIAAPVHLKVDTGMGRIGQQWQTSGVFFKELSRLGNLDIRGIYSHLATAEDDNCDFARTQLQRFQQVIENASAHGIHPPYIHLANSAALLRFGEEFRFTMVRPGLVLYGWTPVKSLGEILPLQPVMTLKTQAVYVKRPPAGTVVGYGATWISPGGRWIATLPVGYGDGFPRRAGNRARVRFRKKNCPIVGHVSMDQITIDAGEEAYLGDEAIIFGGGGDSFLSLWELCDAIDAVPYEILCGLTARVPKIYLNAENPG